MKEEYIRESLLPKRTHNLISCFKTLFITTSGYLFLLPDADALQMGGRG
jgi:hypothetical protein